MRSKTDWASLIVESKLPFLLCFTLHLRAFSKFKPLGGLYLEGRFNGGFFALSVWGAYIWRGLFLEFYGIVSWLIKITMRVMLKNSLHYHNYNY